MTLRKFFVVVLVTAFVLALPADGVAKSRKGNSPAQQVKKAHERAQARKKEKLKEYEKRKEAEGPRDWTLTGTLRGSATVVQFIPDKPTNDDEKAIMGITLSGKARDAVEALLPGKKLADCIGKRVTLTFHGAPEQHGSNLRFDVMGGGVTEWQEIRVLN